MADGANELFVYQLFKNILSSSMVIEGRFFVIKTLGNEVNVDNFGEMIKDALGGLTSTKKYPCALMQPPRETQRVDNKGWSTLECSLFFLTPYKRTSDGDIKSPDLQTNTSDHTLQMDWKDMREVAGDFRKVVRTLLKKPELKVLREYASQPDIYQRITYRGNDNVNGVHLTFWLQLWDGLNCNSLADYTPEAIAAIVIPPVNPHPLHKQ